MASDKTFHVPELDFQKVGVIPFDEISDELAENVGRQFMQTSAICGCVQLTNHGLPFKFLDDYEKAATEFFSLPDEVKATHPRSMITLEGYTNNEIEHLQDNHVENKETYNLTDPDNMSFPFDIPSFKSTSAETFRQITTLSKKILKIMEAGLGLSKGTLLNLHDPIINGYTTLRVLNYPPHEESVPIGTVVCGGHYDTTTLTLQFPHNFGGFEIFHDNEWKYADINRKSIMVFYGKAFEHLTGAKFPAVKHRVVLASEEQRRKGRKSIVLFFMPGRNEILRNVLSADDKRTIKTSVMLDEMFDGFYK